MRSRVVFLMVGLLLASVSGGAFGEGNWPTWRGPNHDSIVKEGNPPLTWSETENIKWKIEMPDNGDCTPIVWGDKMFIQTAVATAKDVRTRPPKREPGEREIFMPFPSVPYKFDLVCLNRLTGEVLWKKTVREEIPHEGHHPDGSLSSYSPVTDGKYVWASFGSRGMYCFDLDGNEIWNHELPEQLSFRAFGEGSSPALAGDAIIVVADHEGDSKIFAFDKMNGEIIWQRDRDEGTTWATPMVTEVDGKLQVITSGTNAIRSYDAKTGEIIWTCTGLTRVAIPTPILGFGNVYCTTGFQDPVMLAIKLGPTGDLTGTDAISWKVDAGTPYIASPLLYGDRIYSMDSLKPSLTAFDARTGSVIFDRERLEGLKQIYSSPVGVADRIYITDRKGKTMVIKHSDSLEVLATNELEDDFDASMVIIGDDIYLKGAKFLYCISES